MASRHGTWNLGSSEPRLEAKIFKTRPRRFSKTVIMTSIWSRDPRTWNLEPPLRPPPAPQTAEPGTWNLLGTWNLEPQKFSKTRAYGAGGTWNLFLLTRDPRNRNLGTSPPPKHRTSRTPSSRLSENPSCSRY